MDRACGLLATNEEQETGNNMERITMSIDEALAKAFDQLISDRGYTSRSEAMRDLLRREVEGHRQGRDPKTFCVASLSYVYDHHARNLAERLTETQHAHHDLVTATMHVHLDHDHCMENVMLKGPTAAVRAFADHVLAERGVRHGQLNIITVEAGDAHDQTGAGKYHHHHGHLHLIPRS
jgi:CopG family nickel-responsive transcriptional regulator